MIRNRKARPDEWETEVIRDKLLARELAEGPVVRQRSPRAMAATAFRVAVPEYYAASCLTCHGNPKGQIDITGYPKEGARRAIWAG